MNLRQLTASCRWLRSSASTVTDWVTNADMAALIPPAGARPDVVLLPTASQPDAPPATVSEAWSFAVGAPVLDKFLRTGSSGRLRSSCQG